MAGVVARLPLADLARRGKDLLTVPLPAAGPLSAQVGREIVQAAVSDVKRRFATGTAPDGTRWRPLRYPRPNGGDQPLRDTGQLAASIVGEHTPNEVVVSTNRVGARLHHFGGKVEPKKAKVLTIPLTKEAKRAGSPRRLVRRKGDPLPLFARMVGSRLVGHFLCVKKVVVPARPFMGLSREGWDLIAAVLAEDAARRWQQGK
jgi:phage gpG-like protein